LRSETPTIAVVLHMIEHQPFGVQFREDFEAAISESGRTLHLEFADSHGSSAEQVQRLEASLRAKVDALVLAAIDAETVKPVLRRYRDAGIPVIAVDNDLFAPELYRSLILSDNLAFGRKMGEFFVEVSGGHAAVVEIRGIPEASPAALRSKGFRDVIAGHPRVHILGTLSGDWRYDRARDALAAWLPQHPEVDCVFAHNDEMARGAWDAAQALRRVDDLLITGVDAIKGQGLSMVMQGKLAATLINPSAGRPAAAQLLALLDGEPILDRTLLQTSLLRSNERVRAWQAARVRRSGS
jgi:ABC-type sugar transport system substrate-binding protein